MVTNQHILTQTNRLGMHKLAGKLKLGVNRNGKAR